MQGDGLHTCHSADTKHDATAPSNAEMQWLIHGDLNCLSCQYNMRGLVGPIVVCPECGSKNDLTDDQPWKSKALPLGIKVREHWPAHATLLGVLLLIMGLPAMLIVFSIRTINIGTFVTTAVVLVCALGWAHSCRKWIRSCRNQVWATMILIVLFFSSLAFGFGVVGSSFIIFSWNVERFSIVWWVVPIVVGTAGVSGLYWARKKLRSAENTPHFVKNWKTWSLPINASLDSQSKGEE